MRAMKIVDRFLRNPVFHALWIAAMVAGPAFGQQPEMVNGRPAVPGQIIVKLRNSDPATISRMRAAFPSAVTTEELSPRLSLHVLRAAGASVSALLQAYANRPDVLYAEPDYIVEAFKTPNDTSFTSL